jgi:hypothetical protein
MILAAREFLPEISVFSPWFPLVRAAAFADENWADENWKSLLGVTLRAKPRDLAFTVHPLVDLGLARETGDLSWFQARVFGDDFPIIFGVALWAKGYFCFCHGALCTISTQKEKPRGGRGLSIG